MANVHTRLSLPHSLLSGVSVLVAARLGLNFHDGRLADLERGLAGAAFELGLPNADAYARSLLSTPRSRNQIEVLAKYLTGGETYFFREKASLDVLEQQVLPELLRSRRNGERRLRIWSAGCCTGEEPYSIAILLDRLLGHDKSWNVTILATDINMQSLQKAAQGIYGEWSFRGTPPAMREKYFKKMQDGRFELDPDIRRMVTLAPLNLADDVYPSVANNTYAMDVILCRNVLMYFDKTHTREIVARFHHALLDGGWLLTSPAETSNALFAPFSAVFFPSVVFYRKTDCPCLPTRLGDAVVTLTRSPVPVELPSPRRTTLDTQAALPKVSDVDGAMASRLDENGHTFAAIARKSADEGRLADAIGWCKRAVAADNTNPLHYYLLGTICQEQDDNESAAQSFKTALYLDPTLVLAHFNLGNIELWRGRQPKAERHFTNALATLSVHADGDVIPESGGLTAGRLAEIIANVLESVRATGHTGTESPS